MARADSLLQEPKPHMPLSKTVIAISLAAFFDALKFGCSIFIFLGPVLAGFAAATWVESKAGGLLGERAADLGVAAGALVGVGTGVWGAPVYMVLGIVLGMAVALFGWMFFLTWFLFSGVPLFKSSRLIAILAGWITSEVPFVGALPTFTVSISHIVLSARRDDKERLKKWKKQNTAQRAGLLQQEQNELQQRQLALAGAANDAEYEAELALETSAQEAENLKGSDAANENIIPESIQQAA